MMMVYHGSYTAIEMPLAKAGRRNLDFGQGFYLTSLKKQASEWAKVIASRKGRSATPTISVYSLDLEKAKNDGIKIKEFTEYNLEWLDYVVDCRKGTTAWKNFDVIEGGVANDNVIDTVEDYEKGIITAEQALGQLRYKKVNHQICITSQKVIDRYLHFIESFTIKDEEDRR